MQLESGSNSKGLHGLNDAVVAIGVFDGLHIGHRMLLDAARNEAASLGVPFVVITFERDPDEIFCADAPDFGKLLSNERRLHMLYELGVDQVLPLPANDETFSLEPAAFLEVLGSAGIPHAIHVGVNFCFGHRALGTVTDILAWCEQNACICHAHRLFEDEGGPVSATRIRALLREGAVAEAMRLLAGRAHSICGRVIYGYKRGEQMGFPTVNLDLSDNTVMLPKEGVYGGYALIDGTSWPAAINRGKAVSFSDATAMVEAHLVGFKGNLYGKTVELSFVEWLRSIHKFESKDELIATVMDNIEWVRQNL